MSEIDCDAAAEAAGYEYAMDCLKEEMEELCKDALRYRWLRDTAGDEWSLLRWITGDAQILVDGPNMDDDIDSAMQEHSK
ncbi:MAG: hypothetical protein [Caudoviricetes sp.]|nr:MAG: hypothetical protein [Caudoviricetes sp.]